MKFLHMLSQRPECTGSGFFFQAMLRESAMQGHKNYALCGVTRETIPHEKVFHGAEKDYILFQGDDLPFPVAGMSDVMPYKSSRFQDLSKKQLDLYKSIFQKKITKAIDKFKPDILLCHHLWIMTSIAKQAFPHIPVAAISHGTDLRQIKNCPEIAHEILEHLGNIDIIYALSDFHKKEISQICSIPQSKIEISGSGFNDEIFHFQEKPEPKPVNILYAGKLAGAKGVPWLLETIKRLDDLDYHLYLAGSGTGKDLETCQMLASQSPDKVTLLGSLDHKNLADYMKKSHIFVLPSFFEGLPLVILEAIACGCRVVTTDLHGAVELAGGKNNNIINFIELPPLETIDKPRKEDFPYLINLLEKRLRQAISSARVSSPDFDSTKKLISHYKWKRVYNRIDSSLNKFFSKRL